MTIATVNETTPDTFSIDDRGYIHGGFDTPIFLIAKRQHNTRVTIERSRHKRLKSTTKGS